MPIHVKQYLNHSFRLSEHGKEVYLGGFLLV